MFLNPFKAFLIKLIRANQTKFHQKGPRSKQSCDCLLLVKLKRSKLKYVSCMARCETLKPSLLTVYTALMEKIISKKILYNSASQGIITKEYQKRSKNSVSA